ncbi:hypothetical protein GCM10023069_69780 [Shinella granuli]
MACALPMKPPPIMATFITLVIGFLLKNARPLGAKFDYRQKPDRVGYGAREAPRIQRITVRGSS